MTFSFVALLQMAADASGHSIKNTKTHLKCLIIHSIVLVIPAGI